MAMTSIHPENLMANARVCEVLDQHFDFCVNLAVKSGILETLRIKGGGFVPIATEGTGGVFFLGASGYLLYVTSEGGAGVIAASLTEGLQLMVAYPYWRDLLKFSAAGDIAQMRQAAPYLEDELLAYEPEFEQYRSFLRTELSLSEASDPIASLHYAVEALSPYVEFDLPKGEEFHSLFNTFTFDDFLSSESD